MYVLVRYTAVLYIHTAIVLLYIVDCCATAVRSLQQRCRVSVAKQQQRPHGLYGRATSMSKYSSRYSTKRGKKGYCYRVVNLMVPGGMTIKRQE